MKFYIEKKDYSFTEDELNFMYLNEGNEAFIFRLGSDVLKIYKPFSRKDRLDNETAYFLSKIETKRILLPKSLIYISSNEPVYFNENELLFALKSNNKEKEFIGYTAEYKDSISIKNLANITIKDFSTEVSYLVEDIKILTQNHISICDLNLSNTLYNGNLFICDPGSYIIDYNHSLSYLEVINNMNLNEYLILEILKNITSLTKQEKEKLLKFSESYYLTEELQKESSSTKSLKSYVKKIVS